jgi:hypothetical protein
MDGEWRRMEERGKRVSPYFIIRPPYSSVPNVIDYLLTSYSKVKK